MMAESEAPVSQGSRSFSAPTGPEKEYALPGVPDYLVQVIGYVERENLPLIWTLQKNMDGFSLLVKLPAKSRKHKLRHHGNRRNKDILSREKDHTRINSCAVPTNSEPILVDTEKRRRKSPSCKRRDRNRRKRWGRRKSSPISQPLNTNPCESEDTGAVTQPKQVMNPEAPTFQPDPPTFQPDGELGSSSSTSAQEPVQSDTSEQNVDSEVSGDSSMQSRRSDTDDETSDGRERGSRDRRPPMRLTYDVVGEPSASVWWMGRETCV
jgi:hypothetical protein